MRKRTVLLALVSVVVMLSSVALLGADTTRETIQGISKALIPYNPDNKHMNVSIANATVTVTSNGTDTVYYVHGWAGVICAKNDGKTVQVTGVVGQASDGKKTITAKSIDVKIIVVQ